jgi:PUA domain protein
MKLKGTDCSVVLKASKNPKRYSLKEKEARKLFFDFSQRLKVNAERFFGSRPHVEVTETEVAQIFIIDGKPLLARSGELLFPTLAFEEFFHFLPKIVVDMGAVPYVCKGADLMAPGVVSIEGDFDENDFLLVVDEHHRKPLMIGVSLFDLQATKNLKHGKIVKNIHYVGDNLWNALKKI